MFPNDFGDVHESALIFVPAATFGQLIPKCDVPEPLRKNSFWQEARKLTRSKRKGRLLPTFQERFVSRYEPGLFRRTHVGVGFNLVPLLFHHTTQLALHGLKRVVDDFLERFVSTVIHLPFICHQLVPRRHGHVDSAPVWISLVMIVIGLLDCDIAAVNVITKSLESC
jgi:hypothetical protein